MSTSKPDIISELPDDLFTNSDSVGNVSPNVTQPGYYTEQIHDSVAAAILGDKYKPNRKYLLITDKDTTVLSMINEKESVDSPNRCVEFELNTDDMVDSLSSIKRTYDPEIVLKSSIPIPTHTESVVMKVMISLFVLCGVFGFYLLWYITKGGV